MDDEPRYTLIHVADLHVATPEGTSRDPVDPIPVLVEALRGVAGSGVRPAAVVFTGDLADHGAAAEYRRLRAAVDLARIGVQAG